MILSFLFYCVIGYLLYRLVFNFILPIFRTTQQIKKSFRSMKEQMNGQMHGQPNPSGQAGTQFTQQTNPGNTQVGEYIDFEEV